ncbi:MAG: hypothetical protein ACXVXW_09835 [Mycobacteriaceae bacterium]
MSKPIARAVVNLMGASNVSQARSLQILRAVADRADVIYASEAGSLRSDEVDPLDPNVWAWVHDPTDAARAGSFFAVRRSVGTIERSWYRLGTVPTLGKRRADSMRARYLIVARVRWADGDRTKEGVGHAPPKRNWFLDGSFFASVRARRFDYYGGDQNRLGPWVARTLGREVRAVHVLTLVLARGSLASRPKVITRCPGNPDHEPFVVLTRHH